MPAAIPLYVREPILVQVRVKLAEGLNLHQAIKAIQEVQDNAIPYSTIHTWLTQEEGYVTPRPWKHRLSQIDVVNNVAECSYCGLTRVRYAPSRDLWICVRGERFSRLKRTFGITTEEAEALWESQSGLCAGCGREMDPPCVDHNHRTGKIRGLLCHCCNRTAGLIGDSPEYLRRLADYLERND